MGRLRHDGWNEVSSLRYTILVREKRSSLTNKEMLFLKLVKPLVKPWVLLYIILWLISWFVTVPYLGWIQTAIIGYYAYERRKSFTFVPKRPSWWIVAVDYILDSTILYCDQLSSLCKMTRMTLPFLGNY